MKEVHAVLVSLKVFSGKDEETLRRLVSELSQWIQVVSLSSIYRVQGATKSSKTIHDIRTIEGFSALVVVLKGVTELSPESLAKRLQDKEKEVESQVLRRSVSINLLAYESLTMMTPQLTLPHPEFHTRAENLVPASEVWGDYHHPVLGQTLLSLTRSIQERVWGEFYAQGKTLLDF